MKKYLFSVLGAAMLAFMPIGASAQNTDIATLLEQIQKLQAQVTALQGQLQQTTKQVTQLQTELQLTRSLSLGSSGNDVKSLQEFLAEHPDIYPERLITGYFGLLTEKAIKRFQEKYGIEVVGIVGPRTRERLKLFAQERKELRKEIRDEVRQNGKKDDDEDDDDDNNGSGSATSTDDSKKALVCHVPPGNYAARHTISVSKSSLFAHLRHGDTLGMCGTSNDGGNGTTTPPIDTTAPVISAITATSTTATTTSVSWTTNEAADSAVWYGTANPLVVNALTLWESNASLVTSHALNLGGLAASTTHYYIVVSKDAAGNTATSSQNMFTTLP